MNKKVYIPFLNFFSHFIPVSKVIKITGQKLFIPVYHTLQGNYPLPHIHHLYPPRTITQFNKDLDFILKYYHPISINELYQIIIGNQPLRKNSFHLTFDDGLREVYELALPILKRKGIPATVFLNSDFVDNRNLFYRYKASLLIEEQIKTNSTSLSKEELLKISFANRHILDREAKNLSYNFDTFLKNQQPYLTSSQIRTLQENDFTFGAHSINHPKYSDISLEEKIRQTTESVQFVKEKFKEEFNTFAFPFNDLGVENEFFNRIDTDLTFGSDLFSKRKMNTHLQRFPMEGNILNTKALFNFKSLYYFMKNMPS